MGATRAPKQSRVTVHASRRIDRHGPLVGTPQSTVRSVQRCLRDERDRKKESGYETHLIDVFANWFLVLIEELAAGGGLARRGPPGCTALTPTQRRPQWRQSGSGEDPPVARSPLLLSRPCALSLGPRTRDTYKTEPGPSDCISLLQKDRAHPANHHVQDCEYTADRDGPWS